MLHETSCNMLLLDEAIQYTITTLLLVKIISSMLNIKWLSYLLKKFQEPQCFVFYNFQISDWFEQVYIIFAKKHSSELFSDYNSGSVSIIYILSQIVLLPTEIL